MANFDPLGSNAKLCIGSEQDKGLVKKDYYYISYSIVYDLGTYRTAESVLISEVS